MEFESEILPTGNPDSCKKQHALDPCGRVLLYVGGTFFSRKHALVQRAGLLNKTSHVAVSIRLRKFYDFSHLISKEGTSGKDDEANIVPADIRPVLRSDGARRFGAIEP